MDTGHGHRTQTWNPATGPGHETWTQDLDTGSRLETWTQNMDVGHGHRTWTQDPDMRHGHRTWTQDPDTGPSCPLFWPLSREPTNPEALVLASDPPSTGQACEPQKPMLPEARVAAGAEPGAGALLANLPLLCSLGPTDAVQTLVSHQGQGRLCREGLHSTQDCSSPLRPPGGCGVLTPSSAALTDGRGSGH